MKEFKDKVAVITDADSGIGLALAQRCAEEGMEVVLAGINENTLGFADNQMPSRITGNPYLQVSTSRAISTSLVQGFFIIRMFTKV
jgi:NADP-dependent 3-hydroxy acid dehydrogenase YdfG